MYTCRKVRHPYILLLLVFRAFVGAPVLCTHVGNYCFLSWKPGSRKASGTIHSLASARNYLLAHITTVTWRSLPMWIASAVNMCQYDESPTVGKVVEVSQDNSATGSHVENLFKWNSIMLLLADGVYVEYVHIRQNSACVSVGDRYPVVCHVWESSPSHLAIEYPLTCWGGLLQDPPFTIGTHWTSRSHRKCTKNFKKYWRCNVWSLNVDHTLVG